MKQSIRNKSRSVFLGITLFFFLHSRAAVKLPALFSDHMVLQQQTIVQVWGWASPGEEVSLAASWQVESIHTATDGSGNWKMQLKTPAAGGPYDIKINGENQVEIKDVLIGEVWFCSGQSNMTFPLKYSDSAKQEIAKAVDSSIRYFGVKRQYGETPLNDCEGSVWQKTSPQTAPNFSAVAYYFARKIREQLRVPVGIVLSGWGGTPAEAWTPKTELQNDDSLQFFLDRWKEIPQKVGADSVQYHLVVAQWEKNKNGSTVTLKPAEPRSYYYYSKPWCEPGVLFNGMVNPVIPYTIKGILWYQGESNVSEAGLYEHLFRSMIKSWRQRWSSEGSQNKLPFYFVQIAPYGYSNLDAAARLRQAQYNIMNTADKTGMAVTIDVGEMNNIHYKHKKEVGDRLAFIALAKSYGCNRLVYKGPGCIKVSRTKKNKLELYFDQALFTVNNGKLRGFEIGYKSTGSDSLVYVEAQSVIEGSKVLVWNGRVKKPLVVRYAWLEAGYANLVNRTGIPAFPFQQNINSSDWQKD